MTAPADFRCRVPEGHRYDDRGVCEWCDAESAEPAPPIDPVDEFYGDIWWVWDVPGLGLRAASLSECATEIRRLRAELVRTRGAA